MKSFLGVLFAICLAGTLTGCGNTFFVGGAINPGSSSVSGMVSVVQVSAIIGETGSTVQVTFVTFVNQGTSSTIGFCGDDRDRFPAKQNLRASFTPGRTCASIVAIEVG
jgi:hypothetical protein